MEDLAEQIEETSLQPQPKNLSVKRAIIRECQWCGDSFLAHGPNQRYCCKNCQTEGTREKSRERQRNFYKRYGKDRYKKRLNPGGVGLGQHAEDDFEVEYKRIQRELKRYNLSSP